MFFELQISGDKFRTMMRNALWANTHHICIENELPLTEKLVFLVDHFELADTTTLSSVPDDVSIRVPGSETQVISGSKIQVAQPIILSIVSLSTLERNNTNQSDPDIPRESTTITIFFDIAMEIKKDKPTFLFTYNHIDFGALTLALKENAPDVMKSIEDLLQSQNREIPLDLPELDRFLTTKVMNAGIVYNEEEDFVATRIEYYEDDAVEPLWTTTSIKNWILFYRGEITSRLEGRDWVVFIDRKFLMTSTWKTIDEQLKKKGSDLKLQEMKSTRWEIVPGVSGKQAIINVTGYVSVPICGDIRVYILVTTAFFIVTPGEMKYIINLDYHLDDWDVATCDLETAGIGAVVGAAVGGLVGVIVGASAGAITGAVIVGSALTGAVVGAVLAAIGTLIAMFVYASTHQPPPPEIEKCRQVPAEPISTEPDSEELTLFLEDHYQRRVWPSISTMEPYLEERLKPQMMAYIREHTYECELPWSLDLGFGSFALKAVTLNLEGLLLGGGIVSGAATIPALSVSLEEFSWGIRGSCSHGIVVNNCGAVYIKTPLIYICEARVLDDPLAQFRPLWVDDPEYGSTAEGWYKVVRIGPLDLKPEYLAHPYPCKVLIKTNAGARLVTLQPPQPLPDEERASLEEGAFQARIGCYQAVDPFWAATGRMNVHWLPYPPPNERVEHLWEIYIRGLQGSESITVRDYAGQEVATARPSSRGEVFLQLFLTPSTATNQITLLRQEEAGPQMRLEHEEGAHLAASQEGRHITIKQLLLVQKALLSLNERCTQLSGGWYRGVPALFVTTAFGIHIYDLQRPEFPALMKRVSAEGSYGALPWQRSLLIWGQQGLEVQPDNARPAQLLFEGQKVYDVLNLGHHLYVSTDERLIVLDDQLHETATLHLPGWRLTGGVGATLLVHHESSLQAIDVSNPQSPQKLGRYTLESASKALHQVGGFGLPNLIFSPHENKEGTLFELRQGDQPAQITQFKQDPWLIGTVRLGRILAHLDADSRLIEVFSIERVKTF